MKALKTLAVQGLGPGHPAVKVHFELVEKFKAELVLQLR
jgi:hypothetical protein